MTRTDKEKIKEAIRLLEKMDKSIKYWRDGIDSGSMGKGENEYVEKGTNYLLLELEQIKKILEE